MKSFTHLFTSRIRPLAILCAAVILAGSSAQADPILFNPAGTGSGGAVAVLTFDEQVGNALAQGAVTAINSALVGLAPGQTRTTSAFTVYYQANVLITSPSGNNIPLGNNVITAVLKFQEVATVTGGSNTVTFTNAASQVGSYFDFFARSNGIIGNNATGVGFANDIPGTTLIYSATVPGDGPPNGNFTNNGGSVSIFPPSPQQSVTGQGGSSLNFNTVFFNGNYFIGNPGPSISFDTTNIVPFKTVPPSASFVNLSGAGAAPVLLAPAIPALGGLNGASGPDVQFQSDASSTFAVPEPASVAMTAMGLVGMGVFASRRRKAVVA